MKQFFVAVWSFLTAFFGVPKLPEPEEEVSCFIAKTEAAAPESFFGYVGLSEFDSLAESRRRKAERSGGVL